MNISYKGDYALKVLLDLANNYPDRLVHSEDIAKRQDIPQNFLEQILLLLKKGGFVQSKKGPNGGYFLTRAPKEITLGDVVRFVEGPIYPISCIDPAAPRTCKETARCVFCSIWQDVTTAIESVVDKIDFEELRERAAKLGKSAVLTYHI